MKKFFCVEKHDISEMDREFQIKSFKNYQSNNSYIANYNICWLSSVGIKC